MGDEARELRKLYKQREAIKSSVESISKYVDKFDSSCRSIKQIQVRLDKLILNTETFNEIQNEIRSYDDGLEDIEGQLKFEDETCTLKAEMEELISKLSVIEVDNSLRASHSSASDTMRLPMIQPPTFSGNLEDWSSFFDTFNALFHNNATLTDVQRLHYLKSSVQGPASDIIKNFSITSDNYKVAYEELVRHYENKGFTIQSHIRSLLHSPKLAIASASELRKLHHHVASHVRALKALGQPVQYWDAWLVTLICGQLDSNTAGEWQLRQDSKDLPTYEQIETFLAKRIFAYEAGTFSSEKQSRFKTPQNNGKSLFTRPNDTKTVKCPLCSSSHRIYNCNEFIKMTVTERKDAVSRLKLCFNCLNFGHQVASCIFSACPRCGKRHNSKLHSDDVSCMPEPKNITPTEVQATSKDNAVLHARDSDIHLSATSSSVMLATALIYVHDSDGQPQQCRAVLDSGSQLNFITSSCAQRLRLSKTNISVSISGVSAMSSSTVRLMPCTISSHCSNYQFSVEFHSLPTITERLPTQVFDMKHLNIPENIKNSLADPQLNIPAPVDILFGAELFYDIFMGARQQLSKHISLHSTKLGWILVGKIFERSLDQSKAAMLSTTMFNDSALSLFTSTANIQIAEEALAEEHFIANVKRDENGKFVVRLPVNDKLSSLGDSRSMAVKRFLNLEKRLLRDKAMAIQYDTFMSEYLKLGHMELASPTNSDLTYYLPHHPVFKASSTTTKMRVVFDGSAITNTGISLNDALLKGSKVQPDIFQILIRFRIHQVAITSDVEKMYRQVLIAPEDRNLQRILYRSNPSDKLSEYRLCTVTYGTKSASYLATRCLSEVSKFIDDPAIRRVISEDFYVDDLLSGGATENECYQIYETLLSNMSSAGFSLRKWCSNSPNLINQIPSACEDSTFVLKLSDDDMISALGLIWQPTSDQLRFTFKNWTPPSSMTKRTLLSDINSVYDPIGLISPALITGKIFIQQLWSLKLGWDDVLPMDLQSRWIKFYNSLQLLQDLIIPRRVVGSAKSKITIHGFCDASKEAFGACLYVHSIDPSLTVQVHLFTSKSRVAPMKATTIPRLELCGALLLAELVEESKNELNCLGIQLNHSDISLWTDSSIVLAWLKTQVPLQAYVSNRVARILDVTTVSQWHHVPSADNPADLITRGIHPSILYSQSIWWNGPQWLIQTENLWPSCPKLPVEVPEIRPLKLVLATVHVSPSWLLGRFSKYMQIIRITALLQRFIYNCKIPRTSSDQRATGALTIRNLEVAREYWICMIQYEAYSTEIKALKRNTPLHRSSCLSKLNPFVDKNGILRVGGRLAYAPLNDSTKFPIVLPPSSAFTELLFKYEHLRLLHIGPQGLLANIQIKFWPIRGRILASRTVHKCIQCFRANPKLSTPFMAPLPRQRTTIARPFSQAGVDFCGPIMIRSGIRRVKSVKAYISVFVCLVTRAVHLELVSSLSTDAFLATLTRFMSRRGQCENLYSDNGTNFVGASRKLNNYFQEASKTHAVTSFLTEKAIKWHFIPPSAPHFGGLWEAAVKSTKQHLTKLSLNVTFTFEEASTVLCAIEGVLNSRPMTPLSNDPSDYHALTPAHFLIGGALTLPPAPDSSNVPQNRLKRFGLVQSYIQQFWQRWSKEYLPQLQARGRWIKVVRNVKIGDLCLLRQEALPPTKWALVRVHEVHPGQDGTVRVVTLRNSAGHTFQRPVSKLAILPTEEDEQEGQSESFVP